MIEAVRLPGTKPRRRDFEYWKLMLFWPVYGVVFYMLEWVFPQDYYRPMYHPLDSLIPFHEWFVIPYVFWYIYMAGSVAYTFFRDKAAFRQMMHFYMIVFGVSTVVFFLYPTCQNFRPAVFPRDNILTRTMGLLYSMDTNTNVCPSLHVSGAIGAALGFVATKRFSTRGWKIINTLLAGSICLSTVFVKQHSVIDVFWGLVLSYAAWKLAFRRQIQNQ